MLYFDISGQWTKNDRNRTLPMKRTISAEFVAAAFQPCARMHHRGAGISRCIIQSASTQRISQRWQRNQIQSFGTQWECIKAEAGPELGFIDVTMRQITIDQIYGCLPIIELHDIAECLVGGPSRTVWKVSSFQGKEPCTSNSHETHIYCKWYDFPLFHA